MRSLTLVAVAVSAAGFAPAMAQTVPDPDPYYGVPPGAPPPVHMRSAPPAGTTWHPNGAQMQMQMQAPMPPPMGAAPQVQQRFVLHRTGPGMGYGMGQNMGPGRRHVEFHRIERGGVVPRFWWGPRVQVRDWQRYGFPQPFAGGRWIRYYDDALLIDGYGRVYDSRPGWDWDRYGDRWSYGEDGVPVYGDEEETVERGDYAYGERYEHSDMGPGSQVRERVYVQQGPMLPPGPCANACGGGYGYGYGAARLGYGPVLVTETTVTEAPVVEARTYVSYETVRVPVRHRRHIVRHCGCRVVAPAPVYGGERG